MLARHYLPNRLFRHSRRYSLLLTLPVLLAACGTQPPADPQEDRGQPTTTRPPERDKPASPRWVNGNDNSGARVKVVKKRIGGQAVVSAAPVSPATPATREGMAVVNPGVATPNGGGFYKDDGLPDVAPADIKRTPDAVPQKEPLHRFANRPYAALGKSYTPFTSIRPYKARGKASWYGKKFHGQKTSTGEIYNMFAMTAAHTVLAIPSYAKVTNLENGKSVVVKVTDRGPFHADRVIDLSYAAAVKLDMIAKGSVMVEVEAIVPESSGLKLPERPDDDDHAQGISVPQYEQKRPALPVEPDPDAVAESLMVEEAPAEPGLAPVYGSGAVSKPVVIPPAPVPVPVSSAAPAKAAVSGEPTPPAHEANPPALPASGIFLQFGAFGSAENAASLKTKLARELESLAPVQIYSAGGMHRVQTGPFATREAAEKMAERILQRTGSKPGVAVR